MIHNGIRTAYGYIVNDLCYTASPIINDGVDPWMFKSGGTRNDIMTLASVMHYIFSRGSSLLLFQKQA